MFQGPTLFLRYVVVSPDLPFGNGMILDAERKYAKQSDDLAARLYLAYGEPELNDYHTPFLKQFMGALENRKYAGFKLVYQAFPNCPHCAVIAPAFQAGLMAVFNEGNHL
jgi:predicted alpha/beta superfamily hydrolase